MFRRTGKALAKYKELRQKKKDLARARSTVTTDGKAGAGAGAGAATSGSVTSKRDTDRAPKKKDDDTDDLGGVHTGVPLVEVVHTYICTYLLGTYMYD